jgi:hypothetical protein
MSSKRHLGSDLVSVDFVSVGFVPGDFVPVDCTSTLLLSRHSGDISHVKNDKELKTGEDCGGR